MPTFDVVSPDGKTFRVNAPEGANQDDAIKYVQENLYKSKASPKPAMPSNAESMSFGEQALAGAGQRVYDILTLGRLFDPLGLGNTKQADEELQKTGGGMTGSIAADIAASALPMVRAQQALQGATRGVIGTARGLGSAGAVSGAWEGATRQGGLSQRLENAAEGFGAGVLGEGAGRAITNLVRGPLAAANVTTEARKLMQEGVEIPPWKATDAARTRDFAERAKASVFAKPIITDAENRMFRSWNEKLLREASPPVPVLDSAGNVLRWEKDQVKTLSDDSLNVLRGRFSDAYDALYKGRVIPVDTRFADDVASTIAATQRYYPSAAADVQGIINKVDDILGAAKPSQTPILGPNGQLISTTSPGHSGVTPGAVKEAIDTVDSAINAAWRQGNAEKAEALEGLAGSLRSMRERGLPPEAQSMAGEVGSAYQKFMQLQRANAMLGAQKSGMITPGQLLSAQKAMDRSKGKTAFARKNVPGQREAIEADRVLGSNLPPVGPGTAEKLIGASLLASPFALSGDILTALGAAFMVTPTGQRFMYGQLPGQGLIGGLLRQASPFATQATRASLLDEN
jgi:hypothetical protein